MHVIFIWTSKMPSFPDNGIELGDDKVPSQACPDRFSGELPHRCIDVCAESADKS